MALVIETGEIVDGANTYITVDYFVEYLTDRGYVVPASLESYLVRSFDYMQGLNFKCDQSEAYEVLEAHRKGQSEIAYRFSTGIDLSVAPSAQIKMNKVDVLEQEFFESDKSTTSTSFRTAMPQAHSF